ncbi:hypothetical protein EI94DRAFT_1771487 [Lactarius quietus]|nr:hypothetical protein EI94DRAFT_1771487 [Lactarius quietus]
MDDRVGELRFPFSGFGGAIVSSKVLFAEMLVTPTGISKGCGIVEFESQEDSQLAIREPSEQPSRFWANLYLFERENESRFGATSVPGKIGMAMAGQGLTVGPTPHPLPYQTGWHDLKDHFTSAGNIIRADVNIGASGRPMELAWQDRCAGLSGPGDFRGGSRGLHGDLRGSGFGCGGGGYATCGCHFSGQDLYKGYSGPHQQAGRHPAGGFEGRHAGAGGYDGGGGYGVGAYESQPSQQIMSNWLGYYGTRSKEAGVVQFAQVAEAGTAIAKFQQYMYGGRPLDVRFNDSWHTLTPTAAKGGQAIPIQADGI